MIIGVISDTHGLLNQSAVAALKGVDCIFHAGDIGGPDVIHALDRLAPVTAVRGNMDQGEWTHKLPMFSLVDINGTYVYIIHDLSTLDLDPVDAGIHIIINGHTHQADIQAHRGVLYLNPGSASYGRYGGSLSVGRIEVAPDGIHPKIVKLGS